MSIHFYTMLKAWRRARSGTKRPLAGAPAAKAVADSRAEPGNAAVYAAGIACAGQVGDRNRR